MDSLIGRLSEGSTTVILSEVCDVRPGPSGSRLSRAPDSGHSLVPVVSPADIKDGKITTPVVKQVDQETASGLQGFQLTSGDIVMTRVGDPPRHALASDEHTGWLVGSSCLRLRIKGRILPAYLNYYLQHPRVREWLSERTTGGVIATLNAKTISLLPVAVPDNSEQIAIVDVLGKLDEKIQAHLEVVKSAVLLREALIPELLTGALKENGPRT